jgi:hypothetical protein
MADCASRLRHQPGNFQSVKFLFSENIEHELNRILTFQCFYSMYTSNYLSAWYMKNPGGLP